MAHGLSPFLARIRGYTIRPGIQIASGQAKTNLAPMLCVLARHEACPAASIIARMPARIGSGRSDQAAKMAARSGSDSARSVQTGVQTASATSCISLPFSGLVRPGEGFENRCARNRTGRSNPSSSDGTFCQKQSGMAALGLSRAFPVLPDLVGPQSIVGLNSRLPARLDTSDRACPAAQNVSVVSPRGPLAVVVAGQSPRSSRLQRAEDRSGADADF